MRKRNEKVFRSMIAKRITLRMFLIYFCIYVVVLLLLLGLITPRLYASADKMATDTTSLLTEEFTNAQDSLFRFTNTLLYSESLLNSLNSFDQNASAQTIAGVEQALSTYVSSNDQLLAASLEDYDHNYFSSHYYRNIVTYESALEDEHYQRMFEHSNGNYYSFISNEVFRIEETDTSASSNFHVLVLTRIMQLNQKPYIVRSYYSLNIPFSHFDRLMGQVFSEYAIYDKTSGLLYESGSHFGTNSEAEEELTGSLHRLGHFKGSKGYYYYTYNASTHWILVSYSPYLLFYQEVLVIFGIITLLYLLSPILYALFLIPITTKMLSPLGQLHKAMEDYSVGEVVSLDIHTNDEIERLSSHYTDMTEKIHTQIEDIKTKEHLNAVVNYKLLATQIDPHFIYNTMNIVNIMARQGNTEAIVEINSSLIKILRERLNSKLSISDTIENELETLYQYNLIMDYRYENKVHTQVDVDPSLLQYQIPKNILQPLAENAFYHGFANMKDGEEGHIDLLIYSVGDEIIIEVSDDGAGISQERLELLNSQSYHIYDDKKPHIGLDNIRQRLAYIYPDQYQFEIHSVLGFGTTVSITIPKS